MKVVRSRAEFTDARAHLAGRVGLVPTMGALHAGHAALLGMARQTCDRVVTTIFVNPTQFGPTEDLAAYPRPLAADLAVCDQAEVDLVWAPGVEDVYPSGPDLAVRIDPGPLGTRLEGASRPGHFAGVLTVVAKLFLLVRPQLAFFGQKDYQQFCLIQQMVEDLDFGVVAVPVPTVREPDGLALSSRNRYLSAAERVEARALSAALFAGRDAAGGGDGAVLKAARTVLEAHPGVVVDYLELRGDELGPAPTQGAARLLVAARVGTTRLIDNVEVLL